MSYDVCAWINDVKLTHPTMEEAFEVFILI